MDVAAQGRVHPQERIDEYVGKGWWTAETGDQLFRDRVAEFPDKIALVDPANRAVLTGGEPRSLTWTELEREVTHLAAELLARGVGPGDVVGVQLPNYGELIQVYLAAWSVGAGVSPLAMQYREHEVETMLGKAHVRVHIVPARFGGRAIAEEALAVKEKLPTLEHVIVFAPESETDDLPEGVEVVHPGAATELERAQVEKVIAALPDDPNRLATICWTSGTESSPKGVRRAHYDWMLFSWCTTEAPNITADDVLLNPFPTINMAGINGMLLPWLRTGARLVQHHPFDVPTYFRQIATERVTYTLAPPAVLWMVLKSEEMQKKVDLSSLTRIGSGSAPLQPAMVRGFQEQFGLMVINFFGSNEGICLLSNPEDFPDPDLRAQFFPRYGEGREFSGRPGQWMRLKLIDPESGDVITENGRVGELYIGGPQMFGGYAQGAQATDLEDADGYIATGDLFEIAGDAGEYLRYVDRAKDMVIRGGMNIAPAELEALIAEHPAVAEVAVIGDPDEQMGERVAAVVALRPDASLSLEELVSFLRARKIASFKLPERLEIVPMLPRNPVGKVLKRDLRQRAGQPAPA